MSKAAKKIGFGSEGGDWEVLEGIALIGKEAPDFAQQDLLFRLALIQEAKRLRGAAKNKFTHGLAVKLSETLARESLG